MGKKGKRNKSRKKPAVAAPAAAGSPPPPPAQNDVMAAVDSYLEGAAAAAAASGIDINNLEALLQEAEANPPGTYPGNIPPHKTSLETNMGVPCWTIEELQDLGLLGNKTGWPDCHVCGKPNSSKFCQLCVDQGLPLEITCSPECAQRDIEGHFKRLHEPDREWIRSKQIVFQQCMSRGGNFGFYERIFERIEEGYPHPRDRNEQRQKMGQQGRQIQREFSGWEERLKELGLDGSSEDENDESDDESGVCEESDSSNKNELSGKRLKSSEEEKAAFSFDAPSPQAKSKFEFGSGETNTTTAFSFKANSEWKNLDAQLSDIQEDAVVEILSHFRLVELDPIRRVSKQLQSACNKRKKIIHNLLKKGASVEIIGLSSERGKQLNGRLAVVNGNFTSGRYPVKITNLTGEVEKIGIKASNLNPFLSPEQEASEKSRLSFINYSDDAKLREGHGRLLDQILMLLRYAVNATNGYSYFDGGWESFCDLPRGDQRVAMCNSQIFTLYRVKPSTAGFKALDVTDDCSVLQNTIRTLVNNPSISLELGVMAKYPKDGPRGQLILRNFVRFMECWDSERVFGDFWLVRICKTGTLMVYQGDEVDDDGYPKLGHVYLVKGIGSQVGEDLPQDMFPFLYRTTLLPLYDMLVYDGLLSGRPLPANEVLKEKINAHVDKAVREQTVIYCGDSALRGLWDSDPPELPQFSNDDTNSSDETAAYEPSQDELKYAKQLLQYAKKIGFKASSRPSSPTRDKAVLIVRRFGWTREDNPDNKCGCLFTHDQHPSAMHLFFFDNFPCYTLKELLQEVLKKSKQDRVVPCLIWMDELQLISPLKEVLRQAGDLVNFHEAIEAEWYPPPSEEEQSFVERNPDAF